MWGASEKFKNLKRFIFRHRPIQKGQKEYQNFAGLSLQDTTGICI
jgi:hypothetical protein